MKKFFISIFLIVTLSGMAPGNIVNEPFGYVAFCYQNKEDINCNNQTDVLSSIHVNFKELQKVNDEVNRINQITDEDNYGIREVWRYPNETGGDCEDFALLKKKMLYDLGYPADSLTLASVKITTNQLHAVLLVSTIEGVFVLDNLTSEIKNIEKSEYKYEKVQSRYRSWVWQSFKGIEDIEKIKNINPYWRVLTKGK